MTMSSVNECTGWQHRNESLACANQDAIRLVNTVTYSYLAPMVICVGVVGDSMTVWILRQSLMRRAGVVYQYLRYLAVTDLLMQLCLIPLLLHLVDIRLCTWWAQVFYSHIGYPMVNALMGTSVWLVVCLTFSQYMAVCRPLTASTYITTNMCNYCTVAAYVCNFLMYVPWAYWRRVMARDECRQLVAGQCEYYDQENTAVTLTVWFDMYQWLRECASRLLPFACLFYMNSRILCEYTRTKRNRDTHLATAQSQSANERSAQEEKRLWMLLGGIMMVFFVSTIPAAPLTILIKDSWNCALSFQIFRSVTNLLEFTKFALNFYLYCMVNPDMRRVCVHKLLCRSLTAVSSQHPTTGPRPNLRALSKAIQSAQHVKHQQARCLLEVPETGHGHDKSAGNAPRRMGSYEPARRHNEDVAMCSAAASLPATRPTSTQSLCNDYCRTLI